MSGHRSAQLDFLPFKCHGINLGRGGKGRIKVANDLFLIQEEKQTLALLLGKLAVLEGA